MGVDPWNPQQALMGAAKMDAENLRQYGSWQRALAAYNAGGGNADKWNDPSFAGGQTYNYVRDILGGQNIGPSVGHVPAGPPAPGPSQQMGYQPSGAQAMLANLILGNTSQMISDPLASSQALMQMAMMRKQLGAAQQVYGPGPSVSTPTALAGHPGQAPLRGSKAGGFLPSNFNYKGGRLDQGHDFQTDPGAPIVAPGAGFVIDVKSDPHGFGPAYPVVHFTSGPYTGKDIYIGHTISQLRPGQRFNMGQVLSHTGTHPIGNAGVPGWAEIGFAPGGVPGSFGQNAPF
jgi:hypothetical protein